MQAVIFDMDGVVLDTERLLKVAWVAIAEEEGLPHIEDLFGITMGLRDDEISEIFLQRYGYTEFPKFHQRAYDYALARIPGGNIPLREGTRELLEELKARHIPVGLASATTREKAERELRAVNAFEYFDTIWTGDMVEHCKPDPALFLGACRDLGADPAESYGIEDAPNGIRALQAAGMRAILAEDQYHPDEEIAGMCEAVLPSMKAVHTYLLG